LHQAADGMSFRKPTFELTLVGESIMKATAPVSCAIIGLYILVASILILPMLRFVEMYALAAGPSSWAKQDCLICPVRPAKPNLSRTNSTWSSDEPEDSEGIKRRNQFVTKVLFAHENSSRCRKVKAMLSKHAFSDIETKSCMGKVFQFVVTRKRQKFLIKIDAFTRKPVEIPRRLSRAEQSPARSTTDGPMSQADWRTKSEYGLQ
jgi:hypothetical protein